MQILIRCNVGGPHGMGHLRRMLTLANALEALDTSCNVVFVTTTPVPMQPYLQAGDFDLIVPPTHDENQILNYLRQNHAGDTLVLDLPYFYDTGQLQAMRRDVPIVRIDHPQAEAGSADLLVLPGLHHSLDTLEKLDEAFGERFLTGGDYVLLGEPALACKRQAYRHRQPWIMFSAGGSDPTGILPLLYDMTRPLAQSLPGVTRIFCGGELAAPFPVKELDPTAWLTGYSSGLYLQHARLTVGLFGVSAYEALYVGTPMLSIGHTPQNIEASEALAAASEGALVDGTDMVSLMREDLCAEIIALWHDSARMRNMHRVSNGMIDGKGAQRLAAHILAL